MSAPRRDAASSAAIVAAALCAVLLLTIVGAPVYTDDTWWHLAAGEHYLRHGLWPSDDPLLHTGLDTGPIQHEWLFGAILHLVNEYGGFHALRAMHALIAALVLIALWCSARRRGLDATAAAVVVSVFALVAWFRLEQLRPDVFTIALTLVVYLWVLQPVGSLAPRAKLVVLIMVFVLWANLHSLFMVGVNLMIAAALGALLHWLLARVLLTDATCREEMRQAARHARLLVILIVLALLATALNPRGFGHHLTFLTSSAESAIWHITDEWSHFHPLGWRDNDPSLSFQAWLLTDLVYLLFAISALIRGFQLLRSRSAEALRRFDCVGFGLGMAALVATLVSVRFVWMCFLPLAYVLAHVSSPLRVQSRMRWPNAMITLLLLLAFLISPGTHDLLTRYASAPKRYLSLGYAMHKYHAEGVSFLSSAGAEGNLFNRYELGGFLGYWLAPSLRTFVDGRAEHYSYRVYLDHSSIMRMRSAAGKVKWLDLLDRYEVDFYFGTGFPGGWRQPIMSEDLRDVPGWLLVFRSYRTAIYMRDVARNADNLDRISDHYRAQGVPFDRQRGFDVARVIRERPDWAERNALVPSGFEQLPRARRAVVLAMLGAYEQQVALDRKIVDERPSSRRARARLIYGLLRMDRTQDAWRAAEALAEVGGQALGESYKTLVQRYRRLRGRLPLSELSVRTRSRINRTLRSKAPIGADEALPIEYLMRTEDYPLARARRD